MVKRKGTMKTSAKKKNKPRGMQPLKHQGTLAEQDEARSKEENQEELDIHVPDEPVRSPAVQHGKMSVHFVGFRTDRTKDRNPIVFLDFSLELEEAHEGRIPVEIEDEWKHFRKGNVKRTEPSGMGTQNLQLSQTSDGSVDLAVTAVMPRAVISRITQKGKGKERKVTRLQMRFLTSYTDDVDRFCHNNFDETVWLAMKEAQRSLGEAEAGEEENEESLANA